MRHDVSQKWGIYGIHALGSCHYSGDEPEDLRYLVFRQTDVHSFAVAGIPTWKDSVEHISAHLSSCESSFCGLKEPLLPWDCSHP